MNQKYVEPFITAADRVLRTELGSVVIRGEPSVATGYTSTRDLVVLIGITGQVEGSVVFSAGEQAVLAMAAKLMGERPSELDEVSTSVFAELGNIVAGNAMVILEQEGTVATISPPSVIMGQRFKLSHVGIQSIIVPLKTDCGELQIAVALRERDSYRGR